MSEMMELAKRCERATGPDRELDELIRVEVERPDYPDARLFWLDDVPAAGAFGEGDRFGMLFERRPYTSSLDAAMMLGPKGEFICLDGPRKYLNIPTPVPNHWRCCIGYSPEHRGWAATPALALCAAALRSRAQPLGEDE